MVFNGIIWHNLNLQFSMLMYYLHLAIRATLKHATCNAYYVHKAMCKNAPISTPLWKWRRSYLVSRAVLPHLRGERGWMSRYSSCSLEGCCPFLAEVIKDNENFIKFKGFYSLFSGVEIFLYLRDFLNYFGLIDFFILVWKISYIKFSDIS